MLRFTLSLTLALHSIAALQAGSKETIAATVNGEAILLADVDAMLARFKPAGPITGEQTKTLRQAVLDELIDETLVKQYLAKHTPKADTKEIDKHVLALAEAQKKLGKTLADFTRETGLTETRLRESFDSMLRFNKLVEGRTSEAEYRAYFTANRAVFEGGTLKVAHIVLRLGPTAADGEIAAATEKLKLLKIEIEAGRLTFAEAAKKYSICPTSKLGGDLGTIARKDGQVEEPIAAAAFALPANGLSEQVRTPAGLHLLRVTERTPGAATTYEKCTEAVKETYGDEARVKLAAQLRSTADLRISLP